MRASPAAVWEAVRRLDLSGSAPIRWLFRLRGLPPSALSLEGLQRLRFNLLGERPRDELLLGIVGRFWTLRGDLKRLDPAGFVSFGEPGFAKAAWNFRLRPGGTDGSVVLSTETRVLCLDHGARRRFRVYWWLVGPFSRWLRSETLRVIRRQAESG